jgi:cytochrome c551/c552
MLNKILIILFTSIYLNASNNNSLLILNGNCTTCHFINKSISAPSMSIVQKRYKKAFKDKETFVNYMSTWIRNPTKEASIMHDMIDKYELMPQMVFDEDTLKDIAIYLYENNLTK